MFTEEICKRIKEDELEIKTPFMAYQGIMITDPFHTDKSCLYYLRFVADDPYCCHDMKFSDYQPMIKILNAIEEDLGNWRIMDEWRVGETLQEYLNGAAE